MSPLRRRQLFTTLALMLLGALAEMLTIAATLPFLATVLAPGDAPSRLAQLGIGYADLSIISAATILAAAAIAAAGIRLMMLRQTQRFVTGLGHDMSARIFGRVLRQPYALFVQRNSSEVLSAMEKVQAIIVGVLQPAMLGITSAFIAVFVVLVLMLIEPGAAAAAAVTLTLLYWLVSKATRNDLHRHSQTIARTRTARIKTVQEGIGGIRDIILNDSQPLVEERFRRVDGELRDAQARSFFIAAAPRFVVEAMVIVLIAALAVLLSQEREGLAAALPTLGALAFGAHRLLPLLQQAFAGWSRTWGNMQLLDDVLALMDIPVARETGADAGAAALSLRQAIRLETLSYCHPGGGHAIREIDLEIPLGARIGITGPTGSGKSTLVDLMTGLLEPTSGRIRVDETVLTPVLGASWRANIAHVPQSIFLLDDSIAANIALGDRPVDTERLRRAAETAQLANFIGDLPDGFSTLVGERGIRLSGGQRQRIGVARALYRDAPILILDEATSALDAETTEKLMRQIVSGAKERTIIVVAHDPAALAHCDVVVRLEDGKLK